MHFSRTAAAAAVAAGLLLAGTGAASAYTMDATGVGWVGKGEVQSVFGWNNKTMQDNYPSVTFVYDSTATYRVTCAFSTPGAHSTDHEIHFTKATDINATVGSTARKNSQGKDGPMTGWYLTGYGTTTTDDGNVPAVGDGCPGNSGLGAVTAVEQTGAGADGGLYAVWNGQRRLLTLTVDTTTL